MAGVQSSTVSLESLRALLRQADAGAPLKPETRLAIETVVKNAREDQPVSLQFLDSFDDGAALAALLSQNNAAAKAPAKKPVDLTGGNRGSYLGSPLNNASAGLGVIDAIPNLVLGNAALSQPVTSGKRDLDPNSVRQGRADAPTEVKAIVASGAPDAAQQVAAVLAKKYGKFDASNSEQNRTAILNALNWVADTDQGIAYNTARLNGRSMTTQSPNQTLGSRSGICRDIHTATAAILSSLMNATKSANGVVVPGAPNGREADVQSVGFATGAEYHDFMVYKDPATGKWNSLEYSKRYALGADTALDAVQDTVGDVPGVTRYSLRGWNDKPAVTNHEVLGADAINSMMSADPGSGTKGEVRASANADGTKSGTVFLTDRLSLTVGTGAKSDNGLTAGLQLNYHKDFEGENTRGWVRAALGAASQGSNVSARIGLRGLDERVDFRTYVIGAKLDGRLETKEKQLIGQHLTVTAGGDADLLAGLPMASGQGRFVVPVGEIVDYSKAVVGLDGTIAGREQLTDKLTLDWAVKGRYQVDLLNAATELVTSEGHSAARSLGADAGRAEVAMALTHTADNGTVTRIEAGAAARLGKPYDAQTMPTEEHHAILTVSPGSGAVNFGIVAQGRTVDHKLIPVDTIGVAVKLMGKNSDLSIGAKSVFPDGKIRHFGQNVEVMISGSIRF